MVSGTMCGGSIPPGGTRVENCQLSIDFTLNPLGIDLSPPGLDSNLEFLCLKNFHEEIRTKKTS